MKRESSTGWADGSCLAQEMNPKKVANGRLYGAERRSLQLALRSTQTLSAWAMGPLGHALATGAGREAEARAVLAEMQVENRWAPLRDQPRFRALAQLLALDPSQPPHPLAL